MMAIRVRPMGEVEPRLDPTERVVCWKCGARFALLRTKSRGGCPDCGSQVAVHRLNLPSMPSGGDEEVIRLPEERALPDRGGLEQSPLRMSVLENGPSEEDRMPRERTPLPPARGKYESAKLRGALAAGKPVGEEERRQIFSEAAPRKEDGRGFGLPPAVTLKALLASVGIATVVLLVLIFAIES